MRKALLLDQVVSVVKARPEAANNDAILLEQVWLRQGWDQSKSLYHNLSHVTRPESITRRRRQAKEAGLIEYSEQAQRERNQAETNEHKDMAAVPKAMSWLND